MRVFQMPPLRVHFRKETSRQPIRRNPSSLRKRGFNVKTNWFDLYFCIVCLGEGLIVSVIATACKVNNTAIQPMEKRE